MDISAVIAALILVAAVVLLVFMMRSKLTHGSSCCGTHEAPQKKVKVSDKNVKHYDYHYEVKLEGMVCSNCATRVENAFNSNEGIFARVDLENKKAIVHSKRSLVKNDAIDILKDLPYTVMGFGESGI